MIRLSFLSALLLGLTLLTAAEVAGGRDAAERVPLPRILATPDRYAGTAVVVRGEVVEIARAVSPNGRRYCTLAVSDGQVAITVFAWDCPSANRGDLVEVAGTFYPWLYNIRRVIVSSRITSVRPAGVEGGGGNRSP